MKYVRYILWVFATAALLLWLAHKAQTPLADNQQLSKRVQQEAAPYPAHFEERLSRLQKTSVTLHAESELPDGLVWHTGSPTPPIGSPNARKGGTLRMSNVGPFPANFLAFGSTTPQFFHYNLFECIDIPLVREHPSTGQEIPGVAEAWSQQGDVIFFRLNPGARYSNGCPVRARDYALAALLRAQCHCELPVKSLRTYGDQYLAIQMETSGYKPVITAGKALTPAEPGFYAEFTGNYAELYAQRIPPTTGAYSITEVQRGRLIVLQKVPEWWASDLPGFRYTHNVERIEHHFLTDEAQVWEMFIGGKLDILQTRNVSAWQHKLAGVPEAEDGRIILHSLKIEQPMPPYGIALNTRTLKNRELRKGILQALDMNRVVDIIFRGYAERMPQFTVGYRHINHRSPQYHYDPLSARASFERAGYTQTGADGILRKPNGEKLSIRFSFTPSEKLNTIATLLAQSAAACGAEIIPEPLPWQNISRQLENSSHELTFWATMPGHPLPNYERFFHSNASGYDAPFALNSGEMDKAIAEAQQATTTEEVAKACAQIDELIYCEAIWLPGWMENRANIATWQHVHLPESYFGPYDIAESHQLWVSP